MIVAEWAVKMKNSKNKNKTIRIALCSIICAISLVLMILTGVIPVGTYALPCLAGILLVVVVIEYGYKWSLLSYLVISILSFILAADKEAAVYFILLFGYYPILKSIIESKIHNRIVQYVIKFAIFNIVAVGSFYIVSFLLAVSPSEFTLFGVYVPWVFLIIGNIFFIFYDLAVTGIVVQYVRRLRNKYIFK